MQKAIQKGVIPFRDALAVARLELEEKEQAELAETAEKHGVEAFKRALARLMAGKGKRGIPAGVYIVVRSIFDKRSEDLKYYEALQKLAQEKGMDVAEYAKKVLIDHVKSVIGET
jgi:aryl-alcohol dehydrogenase-like predicted oxidoreductase